MLSSWAFYNRRHMQFYLIFMHNILALALRCQKIWHLPFSITANNDVKLFFRLLKKSSFLTLFGVLSSYVNDKSLEAKIISVITLLVKA